MARKVRIETNGGLCHVINRGNYRACIFESDGAKKSFLKTLFEACEKHSWELHAYCLMGNHFHLCLGTPLGNLSAGMRWLQATYAMRFSRYRKEHGHLFQGRFKSLVVEPGKHWLDLVDYIHLNPVRARLVDIEMLGKHQWTSLSLFPKKSVRPEFFDAAWMDYYQEFADNRGGWISYKNHLKLICSEEPDVIEKLEERMCSGWCIGSSEFASAVSEDLVKRKDVVRLEREDLVSLNHTRWESLLFKSLSLLDKKEEDALKDAKSAEWKLSIACRLKRETSVTNAWLTQRLNMGTPRSVSAICGRFERHLEKGSSFSRKLG